MKQKYKKYNNTNKKYFKYVIIILLATCFLSIGYASITSVELNITGTATAETPTEIFISNVEQTSQTNLDESQVSYTDYVGTVWRVSTGFLSDSSLSKVTYTITILNNTDNDYTYSGITDDAYDNEAIAYEIDGIAVNDIILARETKEFTVTFEYASGVDITSYILNTTLKFNFSQGDAYNITYNLDGGTVETENPTMYTAKTEDFTLNNPIKTGYIFKGWSGTELTGDENTEVTIAKGSTGDREYTANYTANTYYIKFNSNGGSGSMEDQTMTYDVQEKLTANTFTNTGLAFKEWNTEADGSGTAYIDEEEIINLTETNGATINLYAQYTEEISAKDIDANPTVYYGQAVNNYTSSEGVDTWRIYYADSENVYLIAGDYVAYDYLPATSEDSSSSGNTLTKKDTYKATFNETLINSYSGSAWILENTTASSIASKWLTWINSHKETTTESIKATAYMLDTKAWSSFANSTYADYAIGGPTIELYCASYKDTHPNKYIVVASGYYGYKVKWDSDTSYSQYITGIDTTRRI